MKRQFFLLAFCMISSCAVAQKSYTIEYDKATDQFTYKKRAVASKKQEEKVINHIPKLEEGDVLTVHVKNYNPFLHYVEITSSELIEENAASSENTGVMSILNMVTGGLNPISSFLGTLSDVEGMFGDNRAEGMEVFDEDELFEFNSEQNEIELLISSYNKDYKNYSDIKSKIYEKDLYKNVDEVINKLEKIVLKGYNNPVDHINELYASAKMHALKSGMQGHKIREEFRKFDKEICNFKTFAEDPRNDFKKDDIVALIQALKSATFETQRSFEISADDARSFTIDENSVLTGMVYEINFYDIKEVMERTKSNETESNLNYVSYYYLDRFWNEEGEIVDDPCQGCFPVLRAEGLYEGNAPRYFEDFYDSDDERLPKNATGKWLFYDRDGELSRIDMEPHVRSSSNNNNDRAEMPKVFDLEEVLAEKRNVTAPVRGAVVMRWSTGIYGISSFQGRNEYEANYNETFDTMTVSVNNLTNLRMCFGSQMVFDFRGNKVFSPSMNLGAAIDLWDDRDVHFIAGAGIKFKSFPLLSLTGGIAFTRLNQLNKEYEIGETYETFGFDEVSRKYYGLGYYFGLNVNF